MEHRQQVRQFVLRTFLFSEDDNALADHDSLIRNGIVDSTGMLELIEFLEQSFAFKVADEEMLPVNLESIDAISAFVTRKRAD